MSLVLATKLPTNALNEHVRADVDDTNMHFPKGFLTAGGGTFANKDSSGNIAWQQRIKLPSVINEVDGLSAPPSESNGDIFILNKASVILDVDTIVFQSGNTIRITFNGAPDLSGLVINDHARIRLATNASNNGTFIITLINDGSDFIEITNTVRTNSADDEASDSPATTTTTHRDWDDAGDTDHVTFFSEFSKWFSITPELGSLAFNKASATEKQFKTTGWESLVAGGGTIGGSIAIDQVAFGSGVDAIQGTALFIFDGTKLGVGIAVPTATGHFRGVGATGATFGLKVENSAFTSTLSVRDDGNVEFGTTFKWEAVSKFLTLSGAVATNQIIVDPNASIILKSAGTKQVELQRTGVLKLFNSSAVNHIRLDVNTTSFIGSNNGVGFGVNTGATIGASLHVRSHNVSTAAFAMKIDNNALSLPLLYVQNNANIGMGLSNPGAAATTDGVGVLHVANATTPPVGALTGGGALFYATSGEMHVFDAAGNDTLISPHEKKTNRWIYHSVNKETGKGLTIQMEAFVRAVQEKLGLNFITEFAA